MMYDIFKLNNTTMILLSLSTMLFAGFLLTRITKLAKLPNVTGYIIAGIIIGPGALNLVSREMVDSIDFISDIALAFIAFGVGRYFKKEAFKETGKGIIIITLMESLLAGIAVTLSVYFLFRLEWEFCLLLGAIATATAPASTMVTIRQYKAKGSFVNTLLQVVAFDDAVCLIVFSIVLAVINSKIRTNVTAYDIILPLAYNIGALAVAAVCGAALSRLMSPKRSEDNRLILTVSLLLGISGFCSSMNISPLLSCMLFGAVYINMTKDKELYKQVEKFTPPILSIFFVLSGMNLNMQSFGTFGIIGAAYFIIRIAGKYIGAYLGCVMTKSSQCQKTYLGLALIPQAGVAIGLAFLGKRVLPENTGQMLLTIILSSSVLYELIGPVCAKFALFQCCSIRADSSKYTKSYEELPEKTNAAAVSS